MLTRLKIRETPDLYNGFSPFYNTRVRPILNPVQVWLLCLIPLHKAPRSIWQPAYEQVSRSVYNELILAIEESFGAY